MPLRLRIVSKNAKLLGDDAEKEFIARGGTIGRSLHSDWILPDPKRYVSSQHAMIDFQGGSYYVVDTSRNGVYVNESDTPVGRGHPQRLFDGDRIRIGDFQMRVEIEEDLPEAEQTAMQDSVVRAQLVSEDPSLELAMMDEDKMVEGDALERHLAVADASARLSGLSEVLKLPDTVDNERAVSLLLEGAGLRPADVAGTQPAELMRTAGRLLRLMVEGVNDLLQDRAKIKDSHRIAQTIIKQEQGNPLKFSPGAAEAMSYLLGNHSGNYMPPEDAVKATFADLQLHQKAVTTAMRVALADFLEQLDPAELQRRFDQGLKRGALLSGANKLKYWDLYEESYHVLTHREEGKLPEVFSEEFAHAYEAEIKDQQKTRRAS